MNEDYSPGNSTLGSSEKLLLRSRGKVSIYEILVKREYMQSSTYFFQKISARLMKLLLVTRNSHHHEGF